MDNIHNYFSRNYDYQTRLKTLFEIQDIEQEMFYESLDDDLEEVEKQGYLDEYLDILENEKII